jgi:hypothetical protein
MVGAAAPVVPKRDTGSFSHLEYLPFTAVKIAGEFVRQVDVNRVDRALVCRWSGSPRSWACGHRAKIRGRTVATRAV